MRRSRTLETCCLSLLRVTRRQRLVSCFFNIENGYFSGLVVALVAWLTHFRFTLQDFGLIWPHSHIVKAFLAVFDMGIFTQTNLSLIDILT